MMRLVASAIRASGPLGRRLRPLGVPVRRQRPVFLWPEVPWFPAPLRAFAISGMARGALRSLRYPAAAWRHCLWIPARRRSGVA